MSDILQRLRATHQANRELHRAYAPLLRDAADEIERLRKALGLARFKLEPTAANAEISREHVLKEIDAALSVSDEYRKAKTAEQAEGR